MNFWRTCVWLSCLTGWSLVAFGQQRMQTITITGYENRGCVKKGERLTVLGPDFGTGAGNNRVVLFGAGVSVPCNLLMWTRTRVTVLVPTDARVREGQMYNVGIQDAGGTWQGAIGPLITICEAPQPAPPVRAPETTSVSAPTAPPTAREAALLRSGVASGSETSTPTPVAAFEVPADPALNSAKAVVLAARIATASGDRIWPQVRRLRFAFHVEQDAKIVLRAQHDWNLATGTNVVTWNGKAVPVCVWAPGSSADEQAAYARWVNDAYWLLAPLKLRDPGVKLGYGPAETINGRTCERLQVGFEKVGLTPGDRYDLFVDPETHLVRYWDYMPAAGPKVRGTWDKYRDYSGLQLSTEHHFGDKVIRFSDIVVDVE